MQLFSRTVFYLLVNYETPKKNISTSLNQNVKSEMKVLMGRPNTI